MRRPPFPFPALQRRTRTLGALLLSESPLPTPTGDALAAAMMSGLREHLGLGALPWTAALRAWRARAHFLALHAPAACAAARVGPLPPVSDAALLGSLEAWLAPFLGGVASKQMLAGVDLGAALRSLLTPDQRRFVEEAAPTHFEVPRWAGWGGGGAPYLFHSLSSCSLTPPTNPSGSRLPIDYEQARAACAPRANDASQPGGCLP